MIKTATKKVLLMDDEISLLKATSLLLEYYDFEVEVSTDGFEAVDKFKKSIEMGDKFDIVILDLVVPNSMGGEKTIEELKSIDPDIKAIISSGITNDPVMQNYQNYGFKEILPKPYNTETLLRTLDKVLWPCLNYFDARI